MDQAAAASPPTSANTGAPGQPFFPPDAPPPVAPPAGPASPLDTLAAHRQYTEEADLGPVRFETHGEATANTEGANATAAGSATTSPTDNTAITAGAESHVGTDGVGGTGTAGVRYGDDKTYVKGEGGIAISPDGIQGHSAGELQLTNEELRAKLGARADGLGTDHPTVDMHGEAEYATPDMQAAVEVEASDLTNDPDAAARLRLGVGDPKGLSIQLAAEMEHMTDDERRAFVARTQANIPITESTSIQPRAALKIGPDGKPIGSGGVDVTQQITPGVGVRAGVGVENINGPGGPAVVPSGGVIITPQEEQKPNPTGPLPPPSF